MRSKKRVLILANYPIKKPTHGGQKRVAAIVDEYRKSFTDVKFVAIFLREHYPSYDKGDLYLTGKWAETVANDHLTSDIQIGRAMTESSPLRKKLVHLLQSYKPDIIEIEQVFPFIGLQKILDEINMHPKIIHSSHNIEAAIKKEILELAGMPSVDVQAAVQVIEQAEDYLSQHADLVTAVSEEDGNYLLSHGAKQYILAPNGITKSTVTLKAKHYWTQFMAFRQARHMITFIGSAHLPNIHGFETMIGFRLGFIKADTRLVLAGSVGRHLESYFNTTNILNQPFWRRAINAGILSEDMLSGLIDASDVLLLPIISGGGSNLKTAEAILSDKKVVATTFSFRGYEQYAGLPNIYFADTPDEFRHTIVKALDAPFIKRTEEQHKLAQQVQWKYTLSKMVEEAAQL